MDSLITTFHIDWKIIIAQAINFAIVLAVLYFFALKPLKKLMAERSDRIAKGLTDAKSNESLLASTKAEYDAVLAKARNEAHEIFLEGKKEAEIKKSAMMEDAKHEVESLIASGKKTLENEKARMVDEAKKEIVSLVVAATEKLLEQTADKALDEKITKRISKLS